MLQRLVSWLDFLRIDFHVFHLCLNIFSSWAKTSILLYENKNLSRIDLFIDIYIQLFFTEKRISDLKFLTFHQLLILSFEIKSSNNCLSNNFIIFVDVVWNHTDIFNVIHEIFITIYFIENENKFLNSKRQE